MKEEADDVSNDSTQFEMECYSESDSRFMSTTSYTERSQPHESPTPPKISNQSKLYFYNLYMYAIYFSFVLKFSQHYFPLPHVHLFPICYDNLIV